MALNIRTRGTIAKLQNAVDKALGKKEATPVTSAPLPEPAKKAKRQSHPCGPHEPNPAPEPLPVDEKTGLPLYPVHCWWHSVEMGSKPGVLVDIGTKYAFIAALGPDLTVRLYRVEKEDLNVGPIADEKQRTTKQAAKYLLALGRKHDITKGARLALREV